MKFIGQKHSSFSRFAKYMILKKFKNGAVTEESNWTINGHSFPCPTLLYALYISKAGLKAGRMNPTIYAVLGRIDFPS